MGEIRYNFITEEDNEQLYFSGDSETGAAFVSENDLLTERKKRWKVNTYLGIYL